MDFWVLLTSCASLATWVVSWLIVAIMTTRISLLDGSRVAALSQRSLTSSGSSIPFQMACCQLWESRMMCGEKGVESVGASVIAAVIVAVAAFMAS